MSFRNWLEGFVYSIKCFGMMIAFVCMPAIATKDNVITGIAIISFILAIIAHFVHRAMDPDWYADEDDYDDEPKSYFNKYPDNDDY